MRKPTNRLNLIDDRLFRVAAKDKAFCEELCRIIYNDKKITVLENKVQWDGHNLYGKSVMLDLRCVLGDGTSVNVEIQKSDNDNHQKRIRYNSSILTSNITDPGVNYEKVPDVRVVFISKFDPFKAGFTVYHVDRINRETGEIVDNGLSEIYINAKVKDDSIISELMKVFTEDEFYDFTNFAQISKVKHMLKKTEEGRKIMCGVEQEIFEEGQAEGEAKGKTRGFLESIKNMVEGLDITANKAMDILKIPANERAFYIDKLKDMD